MLPSGNVGNINIRATMKIFSEMLVLPTCNLTFTEQMYGSAVLLYSIVKLSLRIIAATINKLNSFRNS